MAGWGNPVADTQTELPEQGGVHDQSFVVPAQPAARRSSRLRVGGGSRGRPGAARLQPDGQDQAHREQAGREPQAAPGPADRDAGRQASARQDQAAGRLQGRGLVVRPSGRPHHGDGRQGHDVHGHAHHRPRLCHHREGRQARGQGPAAGTDPAERPRLQGWLALRVRHQQGVSLRQHRGQARQSRHAGRADRGLQSARHDPPQLEIRGVRTGRQDVRAGRLELQHLRDQPRHPRPDPPLQSRTAPAWRSSRAASATRSASTGIR